MLEVSSSANSAKVDRLEKGSSSVADFIEVDEKSMIEADSWFRNAQNLALDNIHMQELQQTLDFLRSMTTIGFLLSENFYFKC